MPKLCNVHRELPYGTKFYGVDYFFEAVTEEGISPNLLLHSYSKLQVLITESDHLSTKHMQAVSLFSQNPQLGIAVYGWKACLHCRLESHSDSGD